MWGGIAEQPTCFAPNSNEATRRDFMIASPLWFKAVAGFQVTECDSFPVHQPVDMQVKLAKLHVNLKKFRKQKVPLYSLTKG